MATIDAATVTISAKARFVFKHTFRPASLEAMDKLWPGLVNAPDTQAVTARVTHFQLLRLIPQLTNPEFHLMAAFFPQLAEL